MTEMESLLDFYAMAGTAVWNGDQMERRAPFWNCDCAIAIEMFIETMAWCYLPRTAISIGAIAIEMAIEMNEWGLDVFAAKRR